MSDSMGNGLDGGCGVDLDCDECGYQCSVKKGEEDNMADNGYIDVDVVTEKLGDLRNIVWLEDIASPCCPEYVEHHNSIQKILKKIDEIMEEVK